MPAHNSNRLTPLARALTMRNALRSKLPMTGLGLALSMAVATQVQAQQWTLNIPAQPLDKALQALAAQINVQVLYNPSDLQNLRSSALNGSYDLDQSISTLLAGTGINYQLMGNTLTLLVPSNGAALELSSVSISGKAPGSITEGTGSYSTRSSSSSTRLNLTPQETPQAITVVTRQRMDDMHISNLAEALDSTPGVTVKPFYTGADAPQIWARGSTINNFQIDGVPSASSLANYLQSTSALDRVEVVRGATGMMSGMGNPSATINMIRKRPTYDPQASITAEAGSWDRYGSGFDLSGSLNDQGTVRGRLVADYKEQGSWTDHYKQELSALYGITEFDLSDNTIFTLGVNHLKRNTNSPGQVISLFYLDGSKIDAKPSDNDAADWTYYDHELNSIFTSIEHTFDSGWSIKTELNHTQYVYDSVGGGILDPASAANPRGSILRGPRWAANTQQQNLDSYLTGPFSLFGRQHELIAGMTLSQLESKSPSYTMTSGNYISPDVFDWANTTPAPDFRKTSKSQTEENQYSAYLSTRLHLTDSTTFILGSRLTDWSRDRKSRTLSTGAVTKTKNQENGVLIPYYGIVQDLNENWALYASYTQIFNPQGYSVRDVNNQPFDPEEGTSYEAGIKATFDDGRLNSNLSVFKTEQQNLAAWKGTIQAYELINSAKTEGIEFEFNGELTPGWNISSGYVYSVTRNQEDTRILSRVPRHTIKAFSTYRLPGELDRFTIGGGLQWESRTGENFHVYTQGSYALISLMGRYDISENLSASFNVYNLFNKEYYVAVGGSTAAASIGNFGAPRNFMTSIKYTF